MLYNLQFTWTVPTFTSPVTISVECTKSILMVWVDLKYSVITKTAGGGWTVFQKRMDGSVDFFRVWDDYKRGFGNLTGEFWLGLDKIHRLTVSNGSKLPVDLEDIRGATAFAEYSSFSVASENAKYQLSLGSYTGELTSVRFVVILIPSEAIGKQIRVYCKIIVLVDHWNIILNEQVHLTCCMLDCSI